MSGNNIIQIQQPNRGALYAQLISNLIDEQQQRQAAKVKAQQEAQQKILSAPPEVRPALAKMLGVDYDATQYPLTAEQQYKADFLARANQQLPNLPTSAVQQAGYRIGTGADMPSDTVKMTNANDVYSNPQAFAPQMQTRQGVEDKILPTGGEQLTVGEQSRHNQAEESQTGPLRQAQGKEATAKAAEAQAGIPLKQAQTAEAQAKTRSITSYLPDPDTGAPNPAVQNGVNAVRQAVRQGITPDVVLKRISDKNLRGAISAELTKPENQDIMSSSPLTQAGSKALAEIDPVEKQVDSIISLLEPHKDDNMGGLRAATIAYKLGFSSDNPEPIASQLSRLNLGQIQAIMPFASKSRNYQYIKDIKQHTWDTSKDTFKNMYDKALIIKQNLQNMRGAINQYERVGATGAAPEVTMPATAPANNPNDPLGIMH